MGPRSRTVGGAMLLTAGALVAADGLVAGPHAFGYRWYSVGGIVVAGLSLMMAGASILRQTRQTV